MGLITAEAQTNGGNEMSDTASTATIREEPELNSTWHPIDTAPWNKEVLLTGKSGYIKPHDRFIINGYRVYGWHQSEWNDATGTHLSERGWNPTHWMPLTEEPK